MPEALKEWFFTEKVYDHETAEADCQLCDQEQLRYHFQIQNRHTSKTLWVGSSCILRFQISVYENSALLDSEKSKKKLDKLAQQMRQRTCVRALKRLADIEDRSILSNALKFYKK